MPDDAQREGLDSFPEEESDVDHALETCLSLADEIKRLLLISELREAEETAHKLFIEIGFLD